MMLKPHNEAGHDENQRVTNKGNNNMANKQFVETRREEKEGEKTVVTDPRSFTRRLFSWCSPRSLVLKRVCLRLFVPTAPCYIPEPPNSKEAV